MQPFIEIMLTVLSLLAFIYFQISLWIASIFFILILVAITLLHHFTIFLLFLWIISVSVILFFNIWPLRRHFITAKIFEDIKKKLPVISKTEEEVLEAGDVWWEKELFTGKPQWKKFLKFPAPKLTKKEKSFLDNEVTTLCNLLNDWEMVYEKQDFSKEIWDYIKKERFLGLVIPKEYGGHGFSAFAHSTIIMKIASRSYSAAVDIMVPNSVGLAEFILLYGTEDQKKYYLPRFVNGEEIPCFALTAPQAGSDAGAMPDSGIICYDQFEGQRLLGIRLNWDKRYITLAPVATMICLAFKLYDPEHLLGNKTELGITLAMIPRHLAGIEIGKRHIPLFMGFLNGPIRGKDVFIPLDYIIGGLEMRGKGWWMMMECLSVGRGLSLPALSTATAKLCYNMTSAYAKLREQFHVSIGNFEGIKEALARIGSFAYICEATRALTASAVDQGLKPSIATAITKYHLTEMTRKVVNDAMDIHGGRSIQLGPSNYLGLYYIAQPISITVEGANILTRNLIIFGQGALRCHPYIRQEIAVLKDSDQKRALKKFDNVFFRHIGYTLRNSLRSFVYGLTGGKLISTPRRDATKQFYRQLTRMSAALALVTDLSLGVMGGKLKQRERLSARLGDVLSYLYLASATLKYYEDHEKPIEDLIFINWILKYCLYQIEKAFRDFFANFPHRVIGHLAEGIIFPWGTSYKMPSDSHDHAIADFMMQPNSLRQRMTSHAHFGGEDDICNKMERAFQMRFIIQPAANILQTAIKKGQIKEKTPYLQIIKAKDANILSEEECAQLLEFYQLQLDVIQVDEFNALIGKKQDGREIQ